MKKSRFLSIIGVRHGVRLGVLFGAFLIALFPSCSQAAPRVSSVAARLVYRSVGGKVVERLSLFALGADDDGKADLDELYVMNDARELYWSLRADDWVSLERSGDTWVGSHALAMNDDLSFPRGVYRVVLVDKGGERGERPLSLDQPTTPLYKFPSLSIAAGRYSVVSAYPKNVLVAYDASGAGKSSVSLREKSGKVEDLGLSPNIRSVALWAEDEGSLVGALTEPVPLKPLD